MFMDGLIRASVAYGEARGATKFTFNKDNEHLMKLLNHNIQEIPGVVSTETLISLEQSFSRQVPVMIPSKDQTVNSKKLKALMERMNAEGVIVDDLEDNND